MKFSIEVNAKCGNCLHWVFTDEDDMEFLKDGETFCKLTSKKVAESFECEKLELDIVLLKKEMRETLGFKRSEIKSL